MYWKHRESEVGRGIVEGTRAVRHRPRPTLAGRRARCSLAAWGLCLLFLMLAVSSVSAESVSPPAPSPSKPPSEEKAGPAPSGSAPDDAGASSDDRGGLPVYPPLPDGDPGAGQVKAAVCGGCHGPDGNAVNPIWPKLAGQHAIYIAKQVRDFKAGRRQDPVMAPMAMTLADEDLADVAAYFASQQVRVGAADPSLAERGKDLYLNGRPTEGIFPCIGCHGPNGEGAPGAIEGGFPAVSSQNPPYLEKQLRSFRDGARTNDWESIMQLVSRRLTDEDIAAVAAYLTTLPRTPQRARQGP